MLRIDTIKNNIIWLQIGVVMKKYLLLCALVMPICSGGRLLIKNDTNWAIQVIHNQSGAKQSIVLDPHQTDQIFTDIMAYESVVIQGYGQAWGMLSPSKDITQELKKFIKKHKSELKSTRVPQNDLVVIVKSVAPGLMAPRGDWEVSFKVEPSKGSLYLPIQIGLLAAAPSNFFPRLVAKKLSYDKNNIDHSYLVFSVPKGTKPTLEELKQKKDILVKKLDTALENSDLDEQLKKSAKKNVQNIIDTAYNKLVADLGLESK